MPLDEIMDVGTYETFNAKLQAASNNITDQIFSLNIGPKTRSFQSK